MLKSMIVAGALVFATSAFAQNVQGAGSSGAAPQINSGNDMSAPSGTRMQGSMSNDKDAMSKDKPAASQGTTTGSSGSKAGTSTAK